MGNTQKPGLVLGFARPTGKLCVLQGVGNPRLDWCQSLELKAMPFVLQARTMMHKQLRNRSSHHVNTILSCFSCLCAELKGNPLKKLARPLSICDAIVSVASEFKHDLHQYETKNRNLAHFCKSKRHFRPDLFNTTRHLWSSGCSKGLGMLRRADITF